MTSELVAYDKSELRGILKAFKAIYDEAETQAKTTSSELADFVKGKVVATASQRSKGQISASRIAEGAVVSKSSLSMLSSALFKFVEKDVPFMLIE